jgi:hypothetical protein
MLGLKAPLWGQCLCFDESSELVLRKVKAHSPSSRLFRIVSGQTCDEAISTSACHPRNQLRLGASGANDNGSMLLTFAADPYLRIMRLKETRHLNLKKAHPFSQQSHDNF